MERRRGDGSGRMMCRSFGERQAFEQADELIYSVLVT
jgi:hypothetical protein